MNSHFRFLLALIVVALPLSAGAHNGVDHEPHHGGTLKTYQSMHYEVVPVSDGLQVYFSEASGEQLPASAVSQMAIEIERPGLKTEYVDMAIDPTGVFWEGKCQPVTDPKSVLRVGFMLRGKSALTEVSGESLLAAGKKGVGKSHGH